MPCPICEIDNCQHFSKFSVIQLFKLKIINHSVQTTNKLFKQLYVFVKENYAFKHRLETVSDALQKASDVMSNIIIEIETKGKNNEKL